MTTKKKQKKKRKRNTRNLHDEPQLINQTHGKIFTIDNMCMVLDLDQDQDFLKQKFT